MVSLDKAMVASLKVDGETFEVLVDPDLGLAYRTGAKKDIANILAAEEIFKDARRGERHKSAALLKAFKSEDPLAIAEKILKEGELALTTDQKRRMLEEKRKQIASLIAREAIDPRTGAPHTLARITQAMDESRLDIDPLKDAMSQMDDVISLLRVKLPIKMTRRRVAIKVGPEHGYKMFALVKGYQIEREETGSDGSFMAVLSIPAGLVGEFYDKLNKVTSGQATTKQLD